MALFPWERGDHVPVEFVCEHCGKTQPQEYGKVIVCTCPEAERARSAAREKPQAPVVDMVELRQRRKIG